MTLTTRRLALVGLLAIGGLVAAAYIGIGRPDAATGQTTGTTAAASGITVIGNGSVKAAPDTADFSFGVETQGETSGQALDENNKAVEKVIAAVKGAGVAAVDIQTQQVSVSPRYSQDGQTIVGYSAINSVNVKVRDLGQAGAVVDAAVAAGANQVYGPTFSIASQSGLYQDALGKALEDARSKAEAIAADAGLSLGNITAIVEGGTFGPPVPLAEGGAGDSSVPIEPGQQEIVATLTVTYSIS
jgi:uncharacterized protein YggE